MLKFTIFVILPIALIVSVFYRRHLGWKRKYLSLRDRILWSIICSFLPLTYNIDNGFKYAIDYCFIPIGIVIFIAVFYSFRSLPKNKKTNSN